MQKRLRTYVRTSKNKAHFNRKYPEIKIGDRVKIYRKPGKFAEMKEGFQYWSTRVYEVIDKWTENDMPVYKLEGYENPVRNHEVLKVDGVEKAPRLRVRGKQSDAARLTKPAPPAAVPQRRRLRGKQNDPLALREPQRRLRIVGKQTRPEINQ